MGYKDTFFTPEYAELFRDTAFGGELCNFRCAGIDYNFYWKPIEGTKYKDIVSPYGYSGPLVTENTSDADLRWPVFLGEFHKWCLNNNIIAEFVRLHPFIGNHLPLMEFGGVQQDGEVVYIDLTHPFKFDKGCKSAIKKAERNGLTLDGDWVMDNFEWLYHKTMERNNASEIYYFDK
jgi:hypothetical protein